MEFSRKRRKVAGSRVYDEDTGEVIEEKWKISGKKLNYIMLHRQNLEVYTTLSGGAVKLMVIILDRYIEMGTNRITCLKKDLQGLMKVSYPTLLGFWKELEEEDVITRNGRWHYINPQIASYGGTIDRKIKVKKNNLFQHHEKKAKNNGEIQPVNPDQSEPIQPA